MHRHLDRVEVVARRRSTTNSSLFRVDDHVIPCITTSIGSRWALGVVPRLTHLHTGLSLEYASMWPFSARSEHAVLSLNSTRPSNRRRRRPRFELQLERLEDRQLLSTATSSSPVLFHDTFSSNTPSSAWSFVGGKWSINNGVLSQTSTAAADPTKAMITNQTFPGNLMITSEVQVNSWTAEDSARAGIGLDTNTSNGDGYNLVFHGTNQVQFLDDHVTWGNAYTFNWQVGTWYWFQLAENNGTLEGKVWAAGTAEPQSWMFQQTGWTDLTGGAPALNGGSASTSAGSSTVSFASVSVTTTSVQPDPTTTVTVNPTTPDPPPTVSITPTVLTTLLSNPGMGLETFYRTAAT